VLELLKEVTSVRQQIVVVQRELVKNVKEKKNGSGLL